MDITIHTGLRIPDGHAPTFPISLYELEHFWNFEPEDSRYLIRRGFLLAKSGRDPCGNEDFRVDFLDGIRANVLLQRGTFKGWSDRGVRRRILNPGTDSTNFIGILGRFAVCAACVFRFLPFKTRALAGFSATMPDGFPGTSVDDLLDYDSGHGDE